MKNPTLILFQFVIIWQIARYGKKSDERDARNKKKKYIHRYRRDDKRDARAEASIFHYVIKSILQCALCTLGFDLADRLAISVDDRFCYYGGERVCHTCHTRELYCENNREREETERRKKWMRQSGVQHSFAEPGFRFNDIYGRFVKDNDVKSLWIESAAITRQRHRCRRRYMPEGMHTEAIPKTKLLPPIPRLSSLHQSSPNNTSTSPRC